MSLQLARQQPLTDVCVAPDGCMCVVSSVDGAACVWDLATGAVKHVLQGHSDR
jgi:WD40 repeat protein